MSREQNRPLTLSASCLPSIVRSAVRPSIPLCLADSQSTLIFENGHLTTTKWPADATNGGSAPPTTLSQIAPRDGFRMNSVISGTRFCLFNASFRFHSVSLLKKYEHGQTKQHIKMSYIVKFLAEFTPVNVRTPKSSQRSVIRSHQQSCAIARGGVHWHQTDGGNCGLEDGNRPSD